MLKEGDLIAGRYLLESLIGEGGMASVWRAQDKTLRRDVALKLLYIRGHRDPLAIVDQFLREARIAASVQHRNVIHTVDFGTVDDLPYMVMELLSGESLDARYQREPAMSMEEVVHFASLTLRGLASVHEAGIVHRDLKPQNIFLHRDTDTVYPKILDFGISRSLGDDQERPSAISTQEGMIVGTPDYMSPEQARGERDIDKRADIYSMGAIIYEGITGRLPFQANTIGELIVQIVTSTPKRMRDVRADVPQVLSDCVAQAMAHDREERFVDAQVFRRALLSAAEKAFPDGRAATSEAPGRVPAARSPVGAAPKVVAPPPAAAFSPAGSAATGSSVAMPQLVLPPLATGEPLSVVGNAAPQRGRPGWGDFEGLDQREQGSARLQLAVEPHPPAIAASAAEAPARSATQGKDAARNGGRTIPKGAHAAPDDPAMLGDSPFDGFSRSSAATPLDLDYGTSAQAHMAKSGAQAPKSNMQMRGSIPRSPSRPQPVQQAGVVRRAAPSAPVGPSALWIVPLILLLGLAVLLFAPEVVSLAAPDSPAAAEIEEHNPGLAVSDRRLQPVRRRNVGSRVPALRDVEF